MDSTVLFVNNGSGRNLGDLAMLINITSIVRSMKKPTNIYVPRQLPVNFQKEFKTQIYIPYNECLDRFRSRLGNGILGNVILRTAYFFHILCMIIAIPFIRWSPVKIKFGAGEVQLLNILNSCSAVWLSGGGYLTDKGVFECRCSLLTALFAILLGKKVVMTGQGIGPINSITTELLLKFVVRHSTFIAVRDEIRSMDYLRQISKGKTPIHMAGDDATSLTKKPVKDCKNQNIGKETIRIAVHFRISPYTENSNQLKHKYCETIKQIQIQGWRPVFFIFTSQKQWEEDLINNILRDVPADSYDIIKTEDPREIKQIISTCDLAIGVAYHFVVFCLTCGVPVTALYGGEYYHYKMKGIFQQYSLENCMIKFSNFDPAKTIDNLKNQIEDLDQTKNRLIERTRTLEKVHDQIITNILDTISQCEKRN